MEKFTQLEQYIDVSKNFCSYRLILRTAIDEAEKSQWTNDKIVIPFTSLILQDVYFIKTHSQDYTTAGGINLKVLSLSQKIFIEKTRIFFFSFRNIMQWRNIFPKTLCVVNRVK